MTLSTLPSISILLKKYGIHANKKLSQYYVQDLNENPNLQFIDDESIDVVLCTLSVDLLIKVCLYSIHWIGEILNANKKY